MGVDMYGPNGDFVGACGFAPWGTAARMLPGLVEAVNVRCASAELPFGYHAIYDHHLPHPPSGHLFALEALIDMSDVDEVKLLDLSELNRFLDWCEYLVHCDIDCIAFYGPVVKFLLQRMHRLDRQL